MRRARRRAPWRRSSRVRVPPRRTRRLRAFDFARSRYDIRRRGLGLRHSRDRVSPSEKRRSGAQPRGPSALRFVEKAIAAMQPDNGRKRPCTFRLV
jgi:hypothetical protein